MAPSKKDIARLQTIIKAASSLLDELMQGEAKTTSVRGAGKKTATKSVAKTATKSAAKGAAKGARALKKPASRPGKAAATKRKARK